MPNLADDTSLHSAGKLCNQAPPPEFWAHFNAQNVNARPQTQGTDPAMQRSVRPRAMQGPGQG